MKISDSLVICLSKIIKKQRFVKDIFNSIVHQGGKILLVGGAVRDLFLQKPIQDLDFEVYGLSLQALQNILQQFGPVSFVGKSFGVLRLHGLDIDWSLPRTDSSGRHPVVQCDPNLDFKQAFARRDLTINAMGIDMQSFDLVDPFAGLDDVRAGILRAPDLHFFGQDPLRVLRVMQFVGRFGMHVDENLSQLCKTIDISHVSTERIEQEFSKLFLQSTKPSIGLQWLVTIDKFQQLLPAVQSSQKLWHQVDAAAQLTFVSDHEKIGFLWAVLAASCSKMHTQNHPLPLSKITRSDLQPVIDWMKNRTQHTAMIDLVAVLVGYAQLVEHDLSDSQMCWLAFWLAPHATIRLLSIFISVVGDKILAEKLFQQATRLGIVDAPVPALLKGKDFLDVAQGVQIGHYVTKAYQIQIDQGILDRSELKNLVLKRL